MTNYKFNKNNKYYLIVTGTLRTPYPNNAVIIHKIEIDNINKINNQIRGFLINKSIILNSYQYPLITVNIFEHNLINNIIKLIFSSNLNFDNFESNSKLKIVLKRTKIMYGLYNDDTSFMSEQFYTVESFFPHDICILFFSKSEYPIKDQQDLPKNLIEPTIASVDSSIFKNDILVFNRYHEMLTTELVPEDVKKLYQNYLKDFEKYHIHSANWLKNQKFNYQKKDYTYKMIINMRPLKYDPYMNNTLTSPLEGRTRGFDINPSLKFNIFNKQHVVQDIVDKFYEINGGSGFISRITPRDYNKVYTPYKGYLKQILIDKSFIVLQFDSDYFMPNSVHERDLASVVLGNYFYSGVGPGAGNRGHPEVLEPQPDTKLIFYMVLMGTSNNSVKLSNGKLTSFNSAIKGDTKTKDFRFPPIWFGPGEEVATFENNIGNLVVMFNRKIEFTSDIRYYSKLDHQNNEQKQIDTYIKVRDLIGILL